MLGVQNVPPMLLLSFSALFAYLSDIEGSGAPHACVVGNQNQQKNVSCFVGNEHPHQNSPGRAREGVNPLDFQSRPATCAPDAGADFFAGEPASPEKKSLPCRFRARKSAGFQRNLRKRGAEGNPSPPPPGELERAAALSNFNQKDFPQGNRIRFPRGWQWRGSLLPRHMSVSEFSSPSHSSRTAPRSGGRSSGACRRAEFY